MVKYHQFLGEESFIYREICTFFTFEVIQFLKNIEACLPQDAYVDLVAQLS